MKPITEQRRQELIADCQKEIGNLMLWLECGPLRDRSKTESELLRQQIALASLNAVPVAVTDISEIDDLKNEGWIGNFLAPEFQGVDSEDRVYLYTAPPVPVIKFPDDIDWNDAFKLLDIRVCGEDRIRAFMMGANWRLAEIKHLNGSEE